MTQMAKSVEALSRLDRVLHRHAVRQTASHELATIGDGVKVWRLGGESEDFFASRIFYALQHSIAAHHAALQRAKALAEFLSNQQGE